MNTTKEKILQNLVKLLPKALVRYISAKSIEKETIGLNESYSQEGEDLVINRFFGKRAPGFFVDIGAHHPYWYSNTYKFYKMGWCGINIDALPGTKALFDKLRPNDINIETPISNYEDEELVYYMFNDPALNTFVEAEANLKDGLNHYRVIDKIKMKTQRLSTILKEFLPLNVTIDFMSIDVEGLDLQVLESNDWELFRPKIILVEELRIDFQNDGVSAVHDFLSKRNYKLFAKTINTSFFYCDI
ncbi:MAG: FkbM family methyltransferase [Pelobium sp.]